MNILEEKNIIRGQKELDKDERNIQTIEESK
jgi:hypothetical protein